MHGEGRSTSEAARHLLRRRLPRARNLQRADEAPEGTRVDQRKATFWIGSNPYGGKDGWTQSGVRGIPRYALVDATGKVVSHDFPDEATIEKLLLETGRIDPAKIAFRELEATAKLASSKRYGEAWKSADDITKAKDCKPEVRKAADYVKAQIERITKHYRTSLERVVLDHNRYAQALVLRYRFDGVPDTAWIDDELRTLAKADRVEEEKKAWDYFERGLKKEFKHDRKDRDLDRAKQEFERVLDKYEHTDAAIFAKKRLAVLDKKGSGS